MSIVSHFAKNLRPDHFSARDQILRYLASSKNKSTFREKPKLCLVGYSDSDWARNHAIKKLVLEFVFTLNGRPISYSSKK